MVNSTQFKAVEPLWPFVVHHFYVDTIAAVRRTDFHVWKYIGDEVVFWRFVDGSEDLSALIRSLYEALAVVGQRLDEMHGKHGIQTRNVIGVKGTVWIASAESVPSESLERHLDLRHSHVCRIIQEGVAVATEEQGDDTLPLVDFIGPEIDIGFRIAKFAHDGFLLLNAPLAALLLAQSEEDRIPARVVGLERLKGVWGGRPYPIVWYREPWVHCEDVFAYDEPLDNPLVARVLAGQAQPLHVVSKVLREMNQESLLELLAQHFRP